MSFGIVKSSVLKGIVASFVLIFIYFIIVSLVSGKSFALSQFSQFWYFIVSLAVGFGIQVILYSYIKGSTMRQSPGLIAVSGATSTVAMISCCAHYLVNLLPILGVVGVITVISQYQIQLFWVGLAFNIAGILYMLNKVMKVKKIHE